MVMIDFDDQIAFSLLSVVLFQPLQIRCIHVQLSRQCDLATKCRMSTKMLQTTSRKSSTAMLTYKPNVIHKSSYHDRSD